MRITNKKQRNGINNMYRCLDLYFGDLGWWPARTKFEVIVGAVLTQNTTWKSVEKAIKALKQQRLLTLKTLHRAPVNRIEEAIRPTGYYRQKTKKLKDVCCFLMKEFGGDMRKAQRMTSDVLREKLLKVNGIGPETADSILLYAFSKPVFVVDAYTIRIFERHGLIKGKVSYSDVQDLVHNSMGRDIRIFNQFHAMLVEVGKQFCLKKSGKCGVCPLKLK